MNFSSRKNLLNIFLIIVGIFPIVLFYYLVISNSLNIPYADDFMTILNFLIKYSESRGASDIIDNLFTGINGHFLTFEYLVSLIQFELAGSLDLKVLNIIGNLSLLGIAVILYFAFRNSIPDSLWILYFLPLSFFIFNYNYHEGIFWATVSLQHFCVVFFAFLSIYLVVKKGYVYFVLAFLFAVVALFTSGSGVLTFIAALLALTMQKRFKLAAIWLVAALPMVFIFYRSITIYSSGDNNISDVLINAPQNILVFIINFLGASWNIDGSLEKILPLIFGFMILLLILHLTISQFYKRDPRIYSMIIFLFLTIAVTALARSEIPNGAFASRYKFIPGIMMGLIYMAYLQTHSKRMVFGIAMGLSLIMYIFSLKDNYKEVLHKPVALQRGLAAWIVNFEPGKKTLTAHPGSELPSSHLLMKAIDQKVYTPFKVEEKYFPYFDDATPLKNLPKSEGIELWIEHFVENGKFVDIKGWAFLKGVNSENSNIRLVLRSTEEAFSYSTYSINRPDITRAKKSPHNLDHAGFSAIINTDNLKDGHYTVGLLISNDSVGARFKSVNKSILINRPMTISSGWVDVDSVDFRVNFDEVIENPNSFEIKGKYEVDKLNGRRPQAYIYLKSLVNEYYMPVVADSISISGEYNFSSRLYKHQIPPGKYDVGLLVDNSSHYLRLTEKSLVIPSCYVACSPRVSVEYIR